VDKGAKGLGTERQRDKETKRGRVSQELSARSLCPIVLLSYCPKKKQRDKARSGITILSASSLCLIVSLSRCPQKIVSLSVMSQCPIVSLSCCPQKIVSLSTRSQSPAIPTFALQATYNFLFKIISLPLSS
jgi:hypothetical protein